MATVSKFPPSAFRKREEETFEDYTCVTNWESFIQALENVLTRWGLSADGDPSVREQLFSTATLYPDGYLCGVVQFGSREFQLVYYSRFPERQTCFTDSPMADVSSEFCQGPPLLAWFGLNHALLLRPTEGRITGPTRLSLLLSSIEMAVNTLRCPVPILVHYAGMNLFHGLAATAPSGSSHGEEQTKQAYRSSVLIGALNVDFSIGRLSSPIPFACTHLAGLREVFLDKLGYPWKVAGPSPKLNISARFIYELPFWPKLENLPVRTYPSFSFSLRSHASVSPKFLLATVWPQVPSHAIKDEIVTRVLKPEGANEWYLGLVLQNRCTNHLSGLLKRVTATCVGTKEPRQVVQQYEAADSITGSHSSSFDEDLSEAGSGKTRDSSEGPINEELTGDQLLLNLLFLFPDADSSFMSSSALEVELLNSHFNVIHTWCMRFLRPIRNSLEIHSLSRHFGFPAPTSLVHRLAVLLANLVDSPISADPTQQMMRMFDEFLSDLDNRVQRRIGLPDQSSYVEAEEAVSVQIEVDSARIIPIKSTIFEQKELNTWLPVVSPTQPFSEWPQSARLNLALVFERLDRCIRTGTRESNQQPGLEDHLISPTSQTDDDDVDETLFADVVEEQPNGSDIAEGDADTSNGDSPTGIHLKPYTSGVHSASSEQEAKHILSWLRSLDPTRLLRSLLPSICLEALITLHGMVPQDHNMITLLSEAFGQLENQIYHLLNRIQPDRGTLDSYTDYEQRFTSTLAAIFTLIEEMCERVTCLYELLEYCALNLHTETSDLDRDFLFRLSMNALCIADCWTNELSRIKWTSIPSNMGEDQKCFLTEFKKLFGRIREPDNHQHSLGSVDILEPFRFVSNTPRWFPKHARLSLSEPDVSTYVLYSNIGQPNPVESRAGSQRLYVEAHYLPHPESVLLAGAFSRDTQFF